MKGARSSLLNFTIGLSHDAGRVLLRYFNRTHRIEVKKGAGIVTEADKAAEKLILKKIFRKFPKSSMIAEESGEHHSGSDLCWVVDPLDGTSNYAHGFPWFSVSIGLYVKGRPVLGVVYHPILKETFYAEAGHGAFLDGRRIHVSTTGRMRDALLSTGFYYSRGDKLRSEVGVFGQMNEVALGVRRPGSAALDLAFVACGRFDGFWESGLSPWDVAAGFLIVEEAGGKVTDYRGLKTTMHGKQVVASNGKVHGRMLKLVRVLA